VVQSNLFNSSDIKTVVVCELTSVLKRAGAPGNVLLVPGEGGLPEQSVVNVSRLVTLDKKRDLYRFCVILAQNVQRACEGVKAMSGVIEPVDWHHSADELHECYKAERELEARKRLGALWLVRQGESVSSAAQSMGVGRRTLTRWLSWYREGGLEEVLSRVPGHGALGNECWLSEHQQQELVERSGRGEFRTYEEARQWVEQQWGVEYRYKGMYALLARLGVRPKVPRPAAEKADPEVQEAWKRGAF